jgi:hypothetical protein
MKMVDNDFIEENLNNKWNYPFEVDIVKLNIELIVLIWLETTLKNFKKIMIFIYLLYSAIK